jgi:hypothetical protein
MDGPVPGASRNFRPFRTPAPTCDAVWASQVHCSLWFWLETVRCLWCRCRCAHRLRQAAARTAAPSTLVARTGSLTTPCVPRLHPSFPPMGQRIHLLPPAPAAVPTPLRWISRRTACWLKPCRWTMQSTPSTSSTRPSRYTPLCKLRPMCTPCI